MAHELDMTLGRAAIAFRGDTPWHGLGETIQPDDDLDTIRYKAGLEYAVERTEVCYATNAVNLDGHWETTIRRMPERVVLYRNDTNTPLSVVSDKYQVVQPADVISFYKDLVADYGFQVEVVGGLKGGRKIWALANTNEALNLRGGDKVKGYLLLATSYDGTMATQARFTSVRVVCNNTLTMARSEGKPNVTVPHSTVFNAAAVKQALNISSTWNNFTNNVTALSNRQVNAAETTQFLLNAYYNLASKDDLQTYLHDAKFNYEKRERNLKAFLERMQGHLFNSPGAHLESARGTLWGVLNAVTRDIDFTEKRSGADGRLDTAWFGSGEILKNRAMELALDLV